MERQQMTLPNVVKEGKRYRSKGAVAQRYGKHPKTIDRWLNDPKLNFPRPDLVINRREHWLDETLDRFDREAVATLAADAERD
jgi:hypothetical protein